MAVLIQVQNNQVDVTTQEDIVDSEVELSVFAIGGGVTETQIADAVAAYMAKNTLTSGRIAEVTLLAENWVGEASPYSQIVTIDGVTKYSQVDLTPSAEQLVIFFDKELTFTTANDNGVVTVYAIGQKPLNDYTMQVTLKEVAV